MSHWSEDDFLERLMPLIRQEAGARKESCPDIETICAVVDGSAGNFIRDAVTGHLEYCDSCVQLRDSILHFGRQEAPKHDSEWKQAEKRLDNWAAGFLNAETVSARRQRREESSREHTGSRNVLNPARWGMMQ